MNNKFSNNSAIRPASVFKMCGNVAYGFSLVELLVVVAIIGVLGIFVAPEIINFRPNLDLNGSVRELYGNFQSCKLAAVRHNANCAITFNQTVGADTFSYYIFIDQDKDFIPDAGETVIDSVKLSDYKNISFDTTKGGGDGLTFINVGTTPAIAFQSTGIPSDSTGGVANGTAFLKNSKNKTKSVVISQSGNISIQK